MKLSVLTSDIPAKVAGREIFTDTEITSIHYRSQEVGKGGLFLAIPGFTQDGHDFIDDALERGAAAIITQKPVKKDGTILVVPDTRSALASVSGKFYRNPSRHLFVIGITGTNGKTTTSYILENILTSAGFDVGVIGTINYRYLGKTFNNPVTTPESLDLQRILSDMLRAGMTHVVMEVSSHALNLKRIENCWMDMGIFTNLSRDHLDYHKNIDTYWSVKKRFFTAHLSKGPKKEKAIAVINQEDKRGRELSEQLNIDTISIGFSDDNTVWPKNPIYDLAGISGSFVTPKGEIKFTSSLVGKHNLENLMCAAGAGIAMDISIEDMRTGIDGIDLVPGRLEPVIDSAGRFVYIDYAHTPDALENVLSSLRKLSLNKIICVFGCGGNRDKGKRPRMGAIASLLSDLTVITSDNPRMEYPMVIIEQIVAGISKMELHEYKPFELTAGFCRSGYVIEPDRRRAIILGIQSASPGDAVLIAGKGHESYQILGKKRIPFDDKEVAMTVLEMKMENVDPVAYHTLNRRHYL